MISPAHTLPLTDVGLDLSPLKRLREVSLALAIDGSLPTHLPHFSTIASGTMSKITIVVKFGSSAKRFYRLFEICDWSGIDEDLARLGEFQGGNHVRQIDLVIDLRQANFGLPLPDSRERRRFERSWWIESASKYAFPKFSRAGTIDFILPLPVSASTFYFHIGGMFTPVHVLSPLHSLVGTGDTSIS